MADALPNSFQVRLPLWYLVHRGTAEISAPTDPVTMGLSIGHILLTLDFSDGKALALFSDERRAGAFADAMGVAGLLPIRVADVPQLFELLNRLAPDTTHLGFDPPPPDPGTRAVLGPAPVLPVAEMLATLRPVMDAE